MYKLLMALCLFITPDLYSQTTAAKPKILYGLCTKDSLQLAPFTEWFKTGYEEYIPNENTIASLKKANFSDIFIQVFFGSWCGDSKREVPRFLKLMDAVSFPAGELSLIGLGGSDSLYKQSPQHEENGKGIFRVPTFIIYKKGVEVGRINEFPVHSLEKDLLQLLQNQSCVPNYRSFSFIQKWMTNGTLNDENITSRSLAGQLETLVKNENELNSLGYLLIKQNKKREALQVFMINYYLFPQSANVVSSLGEGYYENGEYERAVSFFERSLELNKESAMVKTILSLLYNAKEKAGK